MIEKPWLCTMEDIRWPVDRQLRPRPSVRDLALAHGILCGQPIARSPTASTSLMSFTCDDLEICSSTGSNHGS